MFDVGRVRFRHCTRQKLDADILRRQNVFAATPAEVLVRCASTARRICNEFAHFLADILRNGGAERTVFSARNTAPTCIGGAPTSCEFQIEISAEETAKFGAPRVKIVKNLQQFRASFMQILAKFCANSIAGCARLRHCTRQQLDAEILQRQNVFAATPAEVLVH